MSKQEKIVCPAVKFIFPNNGEKDEVVVPYVKNHKEEYHVFLLLTKLGVWRSTRYREELGFATSFQRFVDPAEALRIALDSKQLEKDVIDRMIHECAITLKPEDLY